VSQRITHRKRLADVETSSTILLDQLAPLGRRSACCSCSCRRTCPSTSDARALPRSPRARACAPRSSSATRRGSTSPCSRALRERGAALVASETDEAPAALHETARFGYLRLRRTDYQPGDLADWLARVRRSRGTRRTCSSSTRCRALRWPAEFAALARARPRDAGAPRRARTRGRLIGDAADRSGRAAHSLAARAARAPTRAPRRRPTGPGSRTRRLRVLQRVSAARHDATRPATSGSRPTSSRSCSRATGSQSQIYESAPGRASIVARLAGNGRSPGRADAPHGRRARRRRFWKWSRSAARSADSSSGAAARSTTRAWACVAAIALLALAREHAPLASDVIFLGVADEEAGGAAGAGFMVDHHFDLFANAGVVLNEGGYIATDAHGAVRYYAVETAQKVPLWLRLTATGSPGHGSLPRADSRRAGCSPRCRGSQAWATPAARRARAAALLRRHRAPREPAPARTPARPARPRSPIRLRGRVHREPAPERAGAQHDLADGARERQQDQRDPARGHRRARRAPPARSGSEAFLAELTR
jgi:hypothetical protein